MIEDFFRMIDEAKKEEEIDEIYKIAMKYLGTVYSVLSRIERGDLQKNREIKL